MPVRSARSVAPICFSFSARSACSGGRPLPKGAGYPWPTDLAASQQPTERGRLCTSTSTERRNKPNTTNRHPPAPRTPGREANQRDGATGALGHHAPPQPAPVRNGCTPRTHTHTHTHTHKRSNRNNDANRHMCSGRVACLLSTRRRHTSYAMLGKPPRRPHQTNKTQYITSNPKDRAKRASAFEPCRARP